MISRSAGKKSIQKKEIQKNITALGIGHHHGIQYKPRPKETEKRKRQRTTQELKRQNRKHARVQHSSTDGSKKGI
jgi:hypothetical protein